MRRVAIVLSWLPVAALLLVVIAECGVRALYAFAMWRTERFPLLYERVYWAVPPWVQYMSVLHSGPEIGLCMKPHVERTYINLYGPIGDVTDIDALFTGLFPAMPAWVARREPWHLRTNALGFRDQEMSQQKPCGTFRVAVLGDSWTVGINVEREQTYPAVLARRLAEEFPRGRFEVLNFGLIGGTSAVGKRLLPRVLAFEPDAVVLAYGANDESQVLTETRPHAPTGPPPTLPLQTRIVGNLEVLKLWTWYRTHEPNAIATMIERDLRGSHGGAGNDLRLPCGNPRAGVTSYHDVMDGLVGEVRDRGADPVLVYNNVPEFFSHCVRVALTRIAEERGVPLVDTPTLLFERGAADQVALERARALVPATESLEGTPDKVTVVLRVDMTAEPPDRRAFVMGNATQLGSFTPNAVPLFDDGTHGDQVSGDGVWSREGVFETVGTLIYMFTDGDRAASWTGLENYRSRVFALHPADVGRRVYLPIAQFGRRVLRSDGYHPDAAGYEAIAGAILEALKGTTALHRYLEHSAGT